MKKVIKLEEKCPCCGGGLIRKHLDNIVKDGYEDNCLVCFSSVSNIHYTENGVQLGSPTMVYGHGSLMLDGKMESILATHNIEDVIKRANKAVLQGQAKLINSYIYKFNPETKKGEVIWGYGNPFELTKNI